MLKRGDATVGEVAGRGPAHRARRRMRRGGGGSGPGPGMAATSSPVQPLKQGREKRE
jgi:hypothetical protein